MIRFSGLYSYHNTAAFSCGVPILDSYIKERATQDIKRGICAVHILEEKDIIIGFYLPLSMIPS